MGEKTYRLFAGINGAGKSTLYRTHLFDPSEKRINPDELLQGFGGDWRRDADQLKAGKLATAQLKEYLEQGISFNQETTLAGRSILRTIQMAKEKGYRIDLNYVGLESVELAKKRIQDRVFSGGHGIPDEVVEKRYTQSLKNLKECFPFCDSIRIYDNTTQFQMVGLFEAGKELWRSPCPWFDPIAEAVNRARIEANIRNGGYPPKEEIVQTMGRLEGLFHKELTVLDVKTLFRQRSLYDPERKRAIEETADAFIQEERQSSQQRRPEAEPER